MIGTKNKKLLHELKKYNLFIALFNYSIYIVYIKITWKNWRFKTELFRDQKSLQNILTFLKRDFSSTLKISYSKKNIHRIDFFFLLNYIFLIYKY